MRSRSHFPFVIIAACFACALLFVIDPSEHTLIPCVFHKVTGYECAGCGMTRATHHLLHAEWQRAWFFNPLSFAILPSFAYFFVHRYFHLFHQRKLPRIQDYPLLNKLFAIAIVVFMVWRNM